jgi:hypothetical protein
MYGRDGDRTLVQALDPQVMVRLPGLPALQPVADEAGRRLSAALQTVAEAAAAARTSGEAGPLPAGRPTAGCSDGEHRSSLGLKA